MLGTTRQIPTASTSYYILVADDCANRYGPGQINKTRSSTINLTKMHYISPFRQRKVLAQKEARENKIIVVFLLVALALLIVNFVLA